MKQIIDGKTYNTETATEIGGIGSRGTTSGDFYDWTATLYVTKKGAYFMAGHGGALSPFSRSCGIGCLSGGEGIIPLSPENALAYAEDWLDADEIEEFFADLIEEA